MNQSAIIPLAYAHTANVKTKVMAAEGVEAVTLFAKLSNNLRQLSNEDLNHYQRIIKILVETDKMMKEIDNGK